MADHDGDSFIECVKVEESIGRRNTRRLQPKCVGQDRRWGGLTLVVRPNGESSWVLRHSRSAARRDMTLGRWPTVDLKLARTLADAARKMLVNGRDPVAERRAERAKNMHSSDTMLKLFEAWMSKSRSSAAYRGNIEAAFQKDVFPALGTSQPHRVTRGEILTVLRSGLDE